jgi:hypothetical protein
MSAGHEVRASLANAAGYPTTLAHLGRALFVVSESA